MNKDNIYIGMDRAEIDTIKKYLNKEMVVLEWGSGGSTLFFPQFVKKYYSIEHDHDWWERGFNRQPENCQVYWAKQNAPRTTPSKREQFKDYVEYVHCLGVDKFDAVFIDGRARIACGIEVIPYLDKDSIVFLHDGHREEYKEFYTYYDLIDRAESLLVFKLKNGKK